MQQRTLFPFGLGSRGRCDRNRIVVGVTRSTMAVAVRISTRAKQSLEAQITEAVGADVPGDVFDIEVCGNKFFPGWSVYPKEARRDRRRTTDSNMNFFRAGLPYHLNYFL